MQPNQIQELVEQTTEWQSVTTNWQHLSGSQSDIFYQKFAELVIHAHENSEAQNLRLLEQRVTDLREAVMIACAALAASVSLLQRTPSAKRAAPSNKMFAQMLRDYERALEQARE
jgi:hypothetical protein